jgi:hypothetical protein
MKEVAKRFIEASHAGESGSKGDVRHGHTGFVNQVLGEEHSASLRDGNGGSAEVLKKQPAQVALAKAEALGKFLDGGVIAVKSAIADEGEGARNRIRSALPAGEFRSRFRPAAEAEPKNRQFSGFAVRAGQTGLQ